MAEQATIIQCRDAQLDTILTLPRGECRAAIALPHPSNDPSRLQFLFEHLSVVLPEIGVAVLRYDPIPVPLFYGEDEWVPVQDSWTP